MAEFSIILMVYAVVMLISLAIGVVFLIIQGLGMSAMLNKLGKKTAFIGKVGNDQFGKLLKDTIEGIGIECG